MRLESATFKNPNGLTAFVRGGHLGPDRASSYEDILDIMISAFMNAFGDEPTYDELSTLSTIADSFNKAGLCIDNPEDVLVMRGTDELGYIHYN